MTASAEEARTALAPFGAEQGVLTVGGISLERLAKEHGTPLYVYDAAVIRARLRELRAHIPASFAIYYSVKANPNPAVVRVCVEAGTGCEIASAAEYVRARAAGCPPERILFAGPGKGEEELAYVLGAGIGEIHVESDEEIATLERLAARLDVDVDVSIRVNPAHAAAGGAMQMGGQAAAFGIDEERIDEVARTIRATRRLRLRGLHMFAGTQILDADTLVGQWRHAVTLAARLAERAGVAVETVDLGGGLGIPYFPRERPLDLARVRDLSRDLFDALPAALSRTRFVLEPGRYLVGPAGVYVARVRSIKPSRGTTFVLLDGGMHHHLAASGNLGQVIKRDYPLVNGSRVDDDPSSAAVVAGPLCTPLDVLGRKALLPPDTKVGDLIAVLQSGAYGLTASPVGFLSHPMPAEVLVDGGRATRIRPRGTFEQPIVPLP